MGGNSPAVAQTVTVMTTPATTVTEKIIASPWEMEVLQNELIKMRLALDQERRMRLLLEDQLRAVELSRIQVITIFA